MCFSSFSWGYAPTQLVAPRAVRMADAMEAISWITNFTVSFFVIVVCFLRLITFSCCHLERSREISFGSRRDLSMRYA